MSDQALDDVLSTAYQEFTDRGGHSADFPEWLEEYLAGSGPADGWMILSTAEVQRLREAATR